MIHAYAENYLSHARNNFGRMLDVGVNQFRLPLGKFYGFFLESTLARRFTDGEPNALVGVRKKAACLPLPPLLAP